MGSESSMALVNSAASHKMHIVHLQVLTGLPIASLRPMAMIVAATSIIATPKYILYHFYPATGFFGPVWR